tara:strand:- start:10247 stop:11242 length:996 start_codon:yes stop_codon:yes gene_type:complete
MDLIKFLKNADLNEFIDTYFNEDVPSFIEFIKSKGLLTSLIQHFEDNEYDWFILALSEYFNDDPQFVIDYIVSNYFLDVIMDDNRYWLNMEREDLSKFFSGKSSGISNDFIRKMLGEDIPELSNYHNIPDLTDIISDLTSSNLSSLKQSVYKEVESSEVSFGGQNDIITYEVIKDMDEDDLSKFIIDNSPEVYSNLTQTYNNAYEQGLYDELYGEIKNELISLFENNTFSREIPYNKQTYSSNTGTDKPKGVIEYKYQVDITNIISKVIKTVLGWNGLYSDFNDFEYFGDFEDTLQGYLVEEGELLTVNYPEWVDDDILMSNINDMFEDYI